MGTIIIFGYILSQMEAPVIIWVVFWLMTIAKINKMFDE
jgi:hypothetical protein